MVQTEDQYKFIYRAIEHHVNKIKSWCHMSHVTWHSSHVTWLIWPFEFMSEFAQILLFKIISFKLYETLYILMVVGQRETAWKFRWPHLAAYLFLLVVLGWLKSILPIIRPRIPNFKSKNFAQPLYSSSNFQILKNEKLANRKNIFDLFRVMDIPAVIDYVIVQTSRGKSKSDYLKSFTELIDVNLNSFSDILTQIHQGTILQNFWFFFPEALFRPDRAVKMAKDFSLKWNASS